MVLIDLFLLFAHDHSTNIYGPLSFILFFLRTTIRPRIMVLIDLFLLFPINHSTKICGLHSFISFVYTRPFDQNIWPTFIFLLLCTTIRPKMKVLIDLFLLFAHDHSIKLYGPLSFILLLCTTIRRKIRVLINLFLLFVHDHSTKIRGHSYSLINFFLKAAATDMRCFARSKFSRSLLHKKNFSLRWQLVFKLGFVFCQER